MTRRCIYLYTGSANNVSTFSKRKVEACVMNNESGDFSYVVPSANLKDGKKERNTVMILKTSSATDVFIWK
jgi:hypothetical protein